MKQKSKSDTRLRHLQKIGFTKQIERNRKDYTNTKRYHELKYLQKSSSLKSSQSQSLNQIEAANETRSGQFLVPTKIISVTAPKWAIFDYYNAKYVRGYRAHDQHELSVFSKLLVFCTIHTLVTKHKIDMSRFQTIVTKTVVNTYKGQLKQDDIITLDHLLELMLMDEKEEYQLVAAVNIGAYLEKKRKKQYYSVYDADDRMFKAQLQQFYDFVNSYCKTLKLQSIKYIEFDPKLRDEKNKCSAFDIATISLQCLKIPLFNQIMKKKYTQIQVKYINGEGILSSRDLALYNKTIDNPYISYFNVCRNWNENQFISSHCSVFYEDQQNRPIVIVALASYNPKEREKDIQQIIEWYVKEQNLKKKRKLQKKQNLDLQRKMKTQMPEILETKLKTKTSYKYDFKIKGVKHRDKQYVRKTITEVNEEDD